jgi:hypothetical protein
MKVIIRKLPNEDMNPSLLFYFWAGGEVEASCLLGANNDDSELTLDVFCEYSETTFNHTRVGFN